MKTRALPILLLLAGCAGTDGLEDNASANGASNSATNSTVTNGGNATTNVGSNQTTNVATNNTSTNGTANNTGGTNNPPNNRNRLSLSHNRLHLHQLIRESPVIARDRVYLIWSSVNPITLRSMRQNQCLIGPVLFHRSSSMAHRGVARHTYFKQFGINFVVE